MKRNVSLEEISDGRLYELHDMVKAGCSDCKGCSACCRGMGSSIILDPLDIDRMAKHLCLSFEALLADKLELNVVDGIILPNLKMSADSSEQCVFLNEEERCSIHGVRPGICRMFPLGRYYENRGFQYFLQIHECPKENKTKVKVRKWIDTPDLNNYERFIRDWHYFLSDMQNIVAGMSDEAEIKSVSMYILNHFFIRAYDSHLDFYEQFQDRLRLAQHKFDNLAQEIQL